MYFSRQMAQSEVELLLSESEAPQLLSLRPFPLALNFLVSIFSKAWMAILFMELWWGGRWDRVRVKSCTFALHFKKDPLKDLQVKLDLKKTMRSKHLCKYRCCQVFVNVRKTVCVCLCVCVVSALQVSNFRKCHYNFSTC